MIKVTPYNGKSYLSGFVVKGHANFGEYGTDIICASVSVATQMIGYRLVWHGLASVSISKAGILEVCTDTHNDPRVKDYINMLMWTLKEIQRQYPDHIQIKESEY